jgi:hypothetical protein
MNKLFVPVIFIISVFLITSCSSLSKQEKLLVGTWKPVKASPFQENTKTYPVAVAPPATDSTTGELHVKPVAKSQEQLLEEKKERDLQRIIEQQMKTTLKLNADRTCIVETPGKTINGKWKLKNKGSVLFVKTEATGKKISLDMKMINDTSAMAVSKTKSGDISIKFRKQ